MRWVDGVLMDNPGGHVWGPRRNLTVQNDSPSVTESAGWEADAACLTFLSCGNSCAPRRGTERTQTSIAAWVLNLYFGGHIVGTILIIILILLLLGALPTWPYSTGWGYYPSGGLGLVLLIVLILWLMGRL